MSSGPVGARDRRIAKAKTALELIATVLVIVASGSVISTTVWPRTNSPARTGGATRPGELPLPQSPQSLEGAATIGSRAAQVAIIQYSDFQCSYCQMFVRDTFAPLKREYTDTGKVLMGFRHLPLPSHAHARTAAMSAACASEQGRFWDMHDLLFARQAELKETTGETLADTMRLNQASFNECLQKRAFAMVEKDMAAAAALGVFATPTFLIGTLTSDGTLKATHVLVGAEPLAKFKAVLDELLQRPTQKSAWFNFGWATAQAR